MLSTIWLTSFDSTDSLVIYDPDNESLCPFVEVPTDNLPVDRGGNWGTVWAWRWRKIMVESLFFGPDSLSDLGSKRGVGALQRDEEA